MASSDDERSESENEDESTIAPSRGDETVDQRGGRANAHGGGDLARTRSPAGAADGSPAVGPSPIVEGKVPAAWQDRTAREPQLPSVRYRIDHEVARGGLGQVLLAEDTWLGRSVALKQLQAGREGVEPRFRREALITARLQHPGIVPVHDAGYWSSGDPFYTMKLVAGRSLAEAIRETETYEQRLGLLTNVRAVAQTMAFAHDQGVIHRDLKPANVMLGDYGETIVIDWGLAKSLGEQEGAEEASAQFDADSAAVGLTVAGSVVGTPVFMSPEQARGEELDERTDVYALGAILYAVLTGAPPYTGNTPAEAMERVARGSARPVKEVEPQVPDDLAAIVDKAMARRPEDRYPTAAELAADLERFETGKLVTVHDYSISALLARWVARHRAAVAVAAVALILMAGLGVIAIRRIVREKERAQEQESIANQQRAVAQKQSNEVTLLQARSELTSDPTAAMAWLKRVTIDDGNIDDVRAVAQQALSSGVALDVLRSRELITDVAASPDGAEVAVSWSSGGILLYEVESGSTRILPDEHGHVMRVAYSPDGKELAAVSETGVVTLWNLQSSSPRILDRHGAMGTDIDYSNDGRWLASSAQSSRVLVWQLPSGERIDYVGSDSSVWELAFSPDSSQLASAGADGTVRLFDLASRTARTLGSHEGDASTVAFSPGGEKLASVGADALANVWSVADGTRTVLRGHEETIVDACFPGDARRLVTASQDATVGVWDLDTHESEQLTGHTGAAWALACSAADGSSVLSSSHDGTVRRWFLATGDCQVLRGHSRLVGAVTLAGRQNMVSADSEGELRVWRLRERESRLLHENEARIWAFQLSPDGEIGAFAGADGSMGLVDLGSGRVRRLAGHGDLVLDIAYSPRGNALASVSADHTVRLWDLETGKSEVLFRHRSRPLLVTFSPSGEHIGVKFDVDVVLVQSVDGASRRIYGDGTHGFSAVAFSPDGRVVAVAASTGEIQLRDLEGAGVVVLEGHRAPVKRLAFSPRGDHIASCDTSGRLLSWHIDSRRSTELAGSCTSDAAPLYSADGAQMFVAQADHSIGVHAFAGNDSRPLTGHEGVVSSLELSPDGEFLASASHDGTIRVWNLRAHTSRVLSDHSMRVVSAHFSGSNAALVSASRDGEIRYWKSPFADEVPARADVLAEWIAGLTRATISHGGPSGIPR